MGTAPAAPAPRRLSRKQESPASSPWVTRLIAPVGTWLVLGLGTLTATPSLLPSAIWTTLTTRTRHRHD